jgi:hypothetical protein
VLAQALQFRVVGVIPDGFGEEPVVIRDADETLAFAYDVPGAHISSG